eukprot:2431000-Pleurochrysis_carterae.AAC.2
MKASVSVPDFVICTTEAKPTPIVSSSRRAPASRSLRRRGGAPRGRARLPCAAACAGPSLRRAPGPTPRAPCRRAAARGRSRHMRHVHCALNARLRQVCMADGHRPWSATSLSSADTPATSSTGGSWISNVEAQNRKHGRGFPSEQKCSSAKGGFVIDACCRK